MSFVKKNSLGILLCLAIGIPSYYLGTLFPIIGGPVFAILIGMAVAFIVSLMAIKFLTEYVKKKNFKPFGYYRVVLGIILLGYFFVFM